MTFHKHLFFITLLLLTSCSPIEEEDLIGEWYTFADTILPKFTIMENRVRIVHNCGFAEDADYQIDGNRLSIFIKGVDSLEMQINQLDSDSMLLDDSIIYRKNSIDHIKESYPLIGIETNRQLNPAKFFQTIHLYKTKSGEKKIIAGDSEADYSDIPFFLGIGHRNPEVLMFIHEGIELPDLKDMYFHLAADNQRKVHLVLKRNGFNDFDVFVDKVEIWWDELEVFLNDMNMPMPPPVKGQSRANYLESNQYLINVDSPADLARLSGLEKNTPYLVSINKNMALKDYFPLKGHIYTLSKSGDYLLRTEIR